MNKARALELLRRFEPIIRFTKGEQFFPMDVEHYVEHCSLWVQRPGEEAVCLVPQGLLTLETLAQPYPAEFGAVHFLKLEEPLNAAQLAAYTIQQSITTRESFHAGRGRLARVGYASRFVDALFSISLLARGRVPGDTAAAASLVYRHIQSNHKQYRYHGRVICEDGWIVLQYWFFYLFNNWRSGFSGANDHEADWEMICIYLSEDKEGEVRPEWIAYASHDYSGDDLRRRWDDPEVVKVGEHPVIYAGAGSHASYFTGGEYLAEIALPFLRPLIIITDHLEHLWHERLRQYSGEELPPEEEERAASNIFRIPFVDYARGDGLSIGPGQQEEWDPPRLLDDDATWATHFRGLWGLYTRDPFAGEDAPAGPMFNRDGSVRRAWYDPVGWAGLDKVPPLEEALAVVARQQSDLRARRERLRSEVEEKSRQLRGLGVEAAAMRQQPHLRKIYEAHQEQIKALSEEVNQLRAQLAVDDALDVSLERYGAQLARGEKGPLRVHIQHAHHPTTAATLRASRLAEFWAAISIGLMLILFVAVVWFQPQHIIAGLVAILALFISLEAGFRGRLMNLVTSVTVALATVSALILIYEFFWNLVILAVLLTGAYILWENLREFWS